jgi:hypothetical protein
MRSFIIFKLSMQELLNIPIMIKNIVNRLWTYNFFFIVQFMKNVKTYFEEKLKVALRFMSHKDFGWKHYQNQTCVQLLLCMPLFGQCPTFRLYLAHNASLPLGPSECVK